MLSFLCPRSLVSCLLLALVLALPEAGGAEEPEISPARERLLAKLRESGRVSEALLAVYRRADRAPVVITLEVAPRSRIGGRQRRQRIQEQGSRVLADCPPEDFRLRHRFEHAAGIAGELHIRALRRLLRNPAVLAIDLDGGGRGMLLETMPLVGGYTANTAGHTGAGITVATLDSGIDSDHPDLASALVDEHCICPGCCPNGQDTQTGPGAAEDDNGHGSLVAGVLLSRGNLASVGVAPVAELVAVKVLDSGLLFQFTSDIVDALSWVITNYTSDPPTLSSVRVVNLSLATDDLFPDNSPSDCGDMGGSAGLLGDVVDVLISRGVVVVAAAGNSNSMRPRSVVSLPAPACLSNVISVGAVWDEDLGPQSTPFACNEVTTAPDQIACFTNLPAHTNVLAPGAEMIGPFLNGSLAFSFGTSFATPLVSGCAALLVAQQPLRSPVDVTSLILASPTLVTDPATSFSFPRLDCADALGLGPDDDDSDFDAITVGDGDNCPAIANATQSDVETDGVGDACDVCVYVPDPAQTDTDMNGLGDACECTGPILWPGDIDGNGMVDNASDILILEFNFGDVGGVTPSNGDQNCDDAIDGADYTIWADNFGRSSDEAEL